MPPPAGGPGPAGERRCARHPHRATRLACTRCDRPACPECLRPAPVGQHCVDCLARSAQAARAVPRRGNVAGASRTGRPVVVPTLLVANLAVFLATVVTSGSLNRNAASPLFGAGALVPELVAAGEYWRVVTSGFLHIGPLHLAFNLFALWIIGREVETVLGRARFLAVYGVALLGGSAAVMLLADPYGATAGASGAVFGLMGALFVLLRRLRLPVGQVVAVIGVNVVLGFTVQGISWQGHLGGLVLGAAVTAGLVYLGARSPHRRQVQVATVAAGTLLTLALVALGGALL